VLKSPSPVSGGEKNGAFRAADVGARSRSSAHFEEKYNIMSYPYLLIVKELTPNSITWSRRKKKTRMRSGTAIVPAVSWFRGKGMGGGRGRMKGPLGPKKKRNPPRSRGKAGGKSS